MESWRTVVGAFENSRAEPLMLSFFFLLFICHNMFEYACVAQLANVEGFNIQDLGSSPRSV